MFDCAFPFAVEPGAERSDVGSLPFVGFRRQRLGQSHALDQFRLERLVGRGREGACAKCMRHGEAGMVGDDLVDHRQRIGLVGMQEVAGLVQCIDRRLVVVGNGIAALVFFAHGPPAIRRQILARHMEA